MSDTSIPFARAGLNDCWNKIGVRGDGSCPELARHVHCRNCPVYSASAAAKGISSEHRAARVRECAGADVERVDAEARRRKTRVQQRHGHRIRLRACRARQAQHAEHAFRMRPQPLVATQPGERRNASRSRKNQVSGTMTASINSCSSSADAHTRSR